MYTQYAVCKHRYTLNHCGIVKQVHLGCETRFFRSKNRMGCEQMHPLPTWTILQLGDLPPGLEAKGAAACCSSTLICSGNRKILVDPGGCYDRNFQAMLYRRTGLSPEDVDTVFLTHFHRNHRLNISVFRHAVWLMSRVERHWWLEKTDITDEEQYQLTRLQPVEDHPLPGIEILPTPGHTHGSTSLLVETREGMLVVAGDAVLSFDHFDSLEPSFHAEDMEAARNSIERIAKTADLIVPGHDNYFVI